jgi:hypothetical protein
VSTPPHHAAAAGSRVLLVVASDRVSQEAISCAAGLAAGGLVTVVGVGPCSGSAGAGAGESPQAGSGARQTTAEDVRRAVALAISALDRTGVKALGHFAVNGAPSRAVARTARARRVRAIVFDQADGLASDLRRRVHGSGIIVVSAAGRGRRLAAHHDRFAR